VARASGPSNRDAVMSRNCRHAREPPKSPSASPDGAPRPASAPTLTVASAQKEPDLAHAARIKSLGVLTASISHEVKQPLTAIVVSGQSCLQRLDASEPDIEKVREQTKRMVLYAQRAAQMIDRVHAMAVRRAPQQTPLFLDDVIKESLAMLRHEFQSNGVSLSVDFAPALPQVVGDSVQLQQVIVNLAINAIQAVTRSSTRRSVFVRTMLPDSGTVWCTVEDSGPGLNPEQIRFLFDDLFATKGTGGGRGLPISQSIIEAHGGHIWGDNKSALGGARFIFTLPATGVAECRSPSPGGYGSGQPISDYTA
jgi:C4-dicarboxylate-specific signal transduction histidine kinase